MPKRGTPSLWWVRILTDFGKDEYVLAALAVLLIAVALSFRRRCAAIQRSLLLGLGTRLQFLFFAVLVSAARHAKCSNGASAAAGRSSAARPTSSTSRTSREPGLFQLSVRPRHDGLCAGLRRVGGLAAGAACDDRLCACDLRRAAWCCLAHHPSDVVAGALVGDRSARCSCATGLRPAGWDLRSSATAAIVSLVGPSSGRLKGLPGALPPHKSGRRQTARYARFRAFQPNQTSADLTPSDRAAVAVSIVVPVRNEAENVAPLIAEIVERARRPLGLRDHLCQ